jgi:hypothetical protein
MPLSRLTGSDIGRLGRAVHEQVHMVVSAVELAQFGPEPRHRLLA